MMQVKLIRLVRKKCGKKYYVKKIMILYYKLKSYTETRLLNYVE